MGCGGVVVGVYSVFSLCGSWVMVCCFLLWVRWLCSVCSMVVVVCLLFLMFLRLVLIIIW